MPAAGTAASRRLRRSASVRLVGPCLLERDDRNWPEDYGALLDLDLKEGLLVQTQGSPDLGRHGDPPRRVHGNVLVSFSRLPPVPADRVYELWLIPSGRQPEPAGVFRPDLDGSKTLVVVKDLKRYKVIAVTVEASPNGAAAPTQAPGIAGNTGY